MIACTSLGVKGQGWSPRNDNFAQLMLFKVFFMFFVCNHAVLIPVFRQAWRTVEELDQYRDVTTATEAVRAEDVTGERHETRVQTVWRLLKEQLQVLLRES